MLMMLVSRLVKSAQSLGRWVLQASEAYERPCRPETYPADAHESRLPRVAAYSAWFSLDLPFRMPGFFRSFFEFCVPANQEFPEAVCPRVNAFFFCKP